jgi:hypothetical protein
LEGDVRNGKRGIRLMGLIPSADITEKLVGPDIFNLLVETATRNS